MRLEKSNVSVIIMLLFGFDSSQAADLAHSPRSTAAAVSSIHGTTEQKKMIVFFAQPFAGQKEICKSLKHSLSAVYGKSTFLISPELSKKRRSSLEAAKEEGELVTKDLELFEQSNDEIKRMYLEDMVSLPSSHDANAYMEQLKFLMEARSRLNNPENRACFYVIDFWTNNPIMGKRFKTFLSEYKNKYLLIKITSGVSAAVKRLDLHLEKKNRALQIVDAQKALDAMRANIFKRESLTAQYKNVKGNSGLKESLFHLCADTSHCEDEKEERQVEVLHNTPVTSPRGYAPDVVTYQYDSLRIEPRTKRVEAPLGQTGYDDVAAQILFLLNLKTDGQELEKRIR